MAPESATPHGAHPARLLVLIVNYRTGDLTVNCLASLEPELNALPGSWVVVVDGDSRDGSVDLIQREIAARQWGAWVELVPSPENAGFAAGNNLGLQRGLAKMQDEPPDYVFLLNPDTVVRPGAVQTLLAFMESHPEVGVGGGRSEDPDGTPQHCCFRFPSLCNEFASNLKLGVVDRLLRARIARVPLSKEAHAIGWVSGAVMMIRRTVIDQIGLFDDRFFLYYEETDFTLRAARAGWTCWHVPQSRVVHLVGHSSGVTKRDGPRARIPRYWFESRRYYFVKNHGRCYAALADVAAVSGCLLRRVRNLMTRESGNEPPRFLRDLVRHSIVLNPVAK